jgi:hypothetical protein
MTESAQQPLFHFLKVLPDDALSSAVVLQGEQVNSWRTAVYPAKPIATPPCSWG